MDKIWESRELHEHPAKHQAGRFGRVVRTRAGVYCLQVGGGTMSCPQDWAARIEAEEARKDRVTVTLDPGLLKQLDALAESEHRSRSAMIEEIVRRHLEKK